MTQSIPATGFVVAVPAEPDQAQGLAAAFAPVVKQVPGIAEAHVGCSTSGSATQQVFVILAELTQGTLPSDELTTAVVQACRAVADGTAIMPLTNDAYQQAIDQATEWSTTSTTSWQRARADQTGSRDRLQRDWVAKARLVRTLRQDQPWPAWSTGEVLAVALLLDDEEQLAAMEYTRQEALERLRFDLGVPSTTAAAEVFDRLRDQI